MIKEQQQVYSYEYQMDVPAHWRFNEHEEIEFPNYSKVIPIGNNDERFRSMLISSIKKAKETIMLCSFILSDQDIIDELLKATEKGVRCYLLFSTEVQLRKEFQEELSDFDQKTLDAHVKMLDKFAEKVLARTSDHLHAKFAIIDYNTENQKGFMSTANFTYEALTRNQEVGVILNDEEIRYAFDLFRRGFWNESKNELIRKNSWYDVKQLNMKNLVSNNLLLYTDSYSTILREGLQKLVDEPSTENILATYGIEKEHKVVKAIIESANRSKTTLITRPREKNYEVIALLADAGAQIVAFDYLHAKFFLSCTNKSGIIMSANFENKGLDTGFEIGLKLKEEGASELENLARKWIESAPLVWQDGGSVHELQNGQIKIPNGRRLDLKEIVEEVIEDQGIIETKDLKKMQELLNSNLALNKKIDKKIPKKITIKRTIKPPFLPEGASKVNPMEIFQTKKDKNKTGKEAFKSFKFPFEVCRHKGLFYVVLKSLNDLQKIEKYPKIKQQVRFVAKIK